MSRGPEDDDDGGTWRDRVHDLARDAVDAARKLADAVEDRAEAASKALLHGHEDDDDRDRDDRDRDDRDRDDRDRDDRARTRDRDHPGAEGRPGGPRSGRPGRRTGTSRGELDGTPLTAGYLQRRNPPDSWAGPRKDSFLPMLFLRANPGDNGSRPVAGVFWESPDIYILAGVSPQDAPDVPPELGQTAQAGAENTLYAHIWNLGRAAANDVVVEFYWLDPSLGVNAGGLHPIGQATTSLGARGSGKAHAVVKCPEPWIATYANGGHECLIVRAWTLVDDQLGAPPWDASLNRHVGQRNIHVVSAAEAQTMQALTLKIGPLYGAPATVRVERAEPTAMPWLQLHTGVRGQFPAASLATGQPSLTPPAEIGAGPSAGPSGAEHTVTQDGQQTTFATSDAPPGAGQAAVYRISADQDGQVFGGYTVVVTG
jgi:hypothetical protein